MLEDPRHDPHNATRGFTFGQDPLSNKLDVPAAAAAAAAATAAIAATAASTRDAKLVMLPLKHPHDGHG